MSGPNDPADRRETLAHARAELAGARGRRRLDILLAAPDPGALVRALPADELFFTVEELGLADGAELVQLASPAQFRTFLDLGAWRGGELVAERALPWIRAARARAHLDDRSERAWRRKLAALDPELVELLLLRTTEVHDLESEPDPPVGSDRLLRTPDGKYAVELRVEGVEYLAVRGLLDDLIAEEPFRASRLLAAIRWELPSELAEEARRWREGRLHDLGYPPLEEALSWFARPPRSPGGAAGSAARPPGFFLELRPAGSLLARASAALSPEEQQGLELQLVTAANATLVADAVDPSDLEAVRHAVEAARALVELGLGALSGGEVGRASELLVSRSVKRLFQEGFGRLLALRARAQRAAAAVRRPLGSPLAELLAALSLKRPRYFPGVELPREEWGTAAAGAFEPRPFRSEEELRRAEEALEAAEREAQI